MRRRLSEIVVIVSTLCAIAVTFLWIRSHWYLDSLGWRRDPWNISCLSLKGEMTSRFVKASPVRQEAYDVFGPYRRPAPGFHHHHLPKSEVQVDPTADFGRRFLGFSVRRWTGSDPVSYANWDALDVMIPHWFVVGLAGAPGAYLFGR